MPADEKARRTASDIEIKPVYTEADVAALDLPSRLGNPGEHPFTRGVQPTMYRGRLWTMRQYAGFGTAEESNARYRYLLEHGQTGLSVAFDLPTQMGYDSDDPTAHGEVGKVGVAIDTLDDMKTLFAGIPMDKVTTSMTINAPAAMLLLLYELAAEEQGVSGEVLGGTIQNDVLKEYIARGTFIYPPKPALRLITDTFAYCAKNIPKWNTISISGYHMREAGCTAVQEIAFTFADGIAYVEAAIDGRPGRRRLCAAAVVLLGLPQQLLRRSREVPGGTPSLGAHHVGPLRREGSRTRRSCASIRRRTARRSPRSSRRTTSSALPIRRWQRCSAARSRCTPTRWTKRLACRPTSRRGSHCGRSRSSATRPASSTRPTRSRVRTSSRALTAEVEAQAEALLNKVLERGGAVESITWMKREIEESAYREQKQVEAKEQIVVGVNEFVVDTEEPAEVLKLDPSIQQRQTEKLERIRAQRDEAAVKEKLEDIRAASKGSDNLLPPMKEAFRVMATLGEVAGVLREEWGVYRPESTL